MVISGTQTTITEAETLIDLLLRDDRGPDALSAAAAIETALRENVWAVSLSTPERTAVAAVLETAWRTT